MVHLVQFIAQFGAALVDGCAVGSAVSSVQCWAGGAVGNEFCRGADLNNVFPAEAGGTAC